VFGGASAVGVGVGQPVDVALEARGGDAERRRAVVGSLDHVDVDADRHALERCVLVLAVVDVLDA